MTLPEGRAPRVVIDSDVAMPILRYPQPDTNRLATLWQTGRIIPLASQDALDELGGSPEGTCPPPGSTRRNGPWKPH